MRDEDKNYYILATFRKFSLELLPHPLAPKALWSVIIHCILAFFLFFSPLGFFSKFKKPKDVSPFFLDPSISRPGTPAPAMVAPKVMQQEKSTDQNEINIISKKKVSVTVSTNIVKKSTLQERPKSKKTENSKWQEDKLKNIQKLLKEGISPVAVNPVVSSSGSASSSGGGIGMGGSGAGGTMDPYSLYYAAIYSALYEVWQQPSGMAGKGLSVTALLRVARDGSILEKRIIRKSGNTIMDNSVQNALDAVNRFPSFPPEIGTATRDITVEFILTEDQM